MQVNSLKKTFALVLAVLLVSLMLPISAFAEDFLTVTGVITDIDRDNDTFAIQPKNSRMEQVFYIENGLNSFVEVGDTLKVYFRAEDPNTAVQATVVGVKTPPPSVSHKHYSVTGVITDAGMSTITILYKGSYRTFSKEDATIVGAPSGILLGDTVKIVYESGNPQVAIQVVMVAHGKNHTTRPADNVTHYSVTGQIIDMTMNSITIYVKGKYRTFGCEDTTVTGGEDGLLVGDTVRIVYHQDSPQDAVSIRMITKGKNH